MQPISEKITNLFSDKKPLVYSKHSKVKVLVVCSNALRCLEIIKILKKDIAGVSVAKLFSKHLKILESAELLKSHSFQIGVGTPNRLLKLLTSFPDALVPSKLEYCIVDSSYTDKKSLRINDIKDLKKDLTELKQLLGSHEHIELIDF